MTPFDTAQVVLRERQARDRSWWDAMRACYHPDSRVSLTWFDGGGHEFVDRSAAMAGHAVTSRHRCGPPVVHAAGARAVVEMPAVIEAYPVVDGAETVLQAHSRLLYRVDGDRIRGLTCVYERDEIRPALPGPPVAVPVDGRRPSYRLLAWYLTSLDYDVGDDLPGDDRPDLVAAVYEEAFAWLG